VSGLPNPIEDSSSSCAGGWLMAWESRARRAIVLTHVPDRARSTPAHIARRMGSGSVSLGDCGQNISMQIVGVYMYIEQLSQFCLRTLFIIFFS